MYLQVTSIFFCAESNTWVVISRLVLLTVSFFTGTDNFFLVFLIFTNFGLYPAHCKCYTSNILHSLIFLWEVVILFVLGGKKLNGLSVKILSLGWQFKSWFSSFTLSLASWCLTLECMIQGSAWDLDRTYPEIFCSLALSFLIFFPQLSRGWWPPWILIQVFQTRKPGGHGLLSWVYIESIEYILMFSCYITH